MMEHEVNTKIFKSDELDQFASAFVKMQAELVSAKKDAKGYGYNYSDLATVIDSSREALTKNGFGVTQLPEEIVNDHVRVTTILIHSSGQFIGATSSMPIIEMKGCNPAQGAGASLSYLRRYAYQAITGQASEDNDASSEGVEKKTFKKAAPPPQVKQKDEDKTEEPKESKPKATRFRRSAVKKDDDDI